MKINNREFKEWTAEDLHEIIENEAYRENEYIDYKETFAILECQDKESRRRKQNEFRHDICSFANADGGYLVFGIKEAAGVPVEINGIIISDIDKFELDRRNELSGILPAVPKTEFSFVKLSTGNYVVIIKISRGVHKPYLYKENENDYKFFVRRGNRKQAMSYMEIRDSFLHSHSFAAELKRFRRERLLFYMEENPDTPFALIHVIPEEFSNDVDMGLLFNEYKEKRIQFDKYFNGLCYGHVCPNVDGVCFPDCGYDHNLFLQLFNNGIVELFYEADVRERNGNKWMSTPIILEKMKEAVVGTSGLFALKGKHTTVYICVTISGCKGLWSDSDFYTDYSAQVDRNEINCMPVEIQDITDAEMVNEGINKCAMIVNYSVGRRNNEPIAGR